MLKHNIIRKLATTLVSSDELIFGEGEADERLRLQFEAIASLMKKTSCWLKAVLEGLILKHQAKQSIQRQAATKENK